MRWKRNLLVAIDIIVIVLAMTGVIIDAINMIWVSVALYVAVIALSMYLLARDMRDDT